MSDPKVDMTTLECITGGSIDNVLKTLPRMGRVMVIAKTDRGVTHERIGPVDAGGQPCGLEIETTGPS
jgi:hypothetical protein